MVKWTEGVDRPKSGSLVSRSGQQGARGLCAGEHGLDIHGVALQGGAQLVLRVAHFETYDKELRRAL